jgi:polar amino acid transport system ATP-binding protein
MSAVQLMDVHKHFGPLEVLKGVSLSVDRGKVVALIGRSGSGKTTLLRCINGLERISSGKIVVEGMEVGTRESELRALRQMVGIVFQSFNLFPHLTVSRNITLALKLVKKMGKAEAQGIAEQVLSQVGLLDKINAYPEQLSGGQQQRVAIARSLAMMPKVLLLDEVTSALDPELKEEVLRAVADLAAQGMTMICVTHEMGFARSVSSEIVFMHQGKVHETGEPEKIFKDPSTPELRQFIASVMI